MGMDWVEVDRDRFVVGALVNTVQNFQGRKFLGQLSILPEFSRWILLHGLSYFENSTSYKVNVTKYSQLKKLTRIFGA